MGEFGMTVLSELGFEPIIGFIHVPSETVPTFVRATTASV